MPTASARSDRLNMRVSPEALSTIREAAAAQQQDVSSFVLGAAMEHAREVLLRDRILQLTPRELDQVDAALDAEPQAVPELAALIAAVGRDATRRGAKDLAAH
ncbi:type II toxin-antitoxin system TacA family antitoxin [Cellulomonas gelida]|uniref:DUF1778 domain-containing protein n=1 Tax=Cellulomonas gelida TaxID=1712 RepID=A0A4Y3KKU3_9CELL|nr:DUF1778 domain-containing protein [Cellulomonas gelida]GEA84513.1 hypothetical protein CGE01nite_17640 [Cellulomonas gelida]GGL38329.1 hypothetical protein GCM10009774_31240 [Cellulomonas gelida]